MEKNPIKSVVYRGCGASDLQWRTDDQIPGLNFFTPVVGEDYALYYNANFWMIIPAYIFSIKASGNPATIGAFQGTLNHANGFFHESFGYEGSITATILATASILWLICRLKKEGTPD